ncbi:MAG: HAD hydrolase-like protein, partial [Euryarchaeota archaeon]|nr:HAD hydrolase-like protein [Euryarchaeota archaeon]
MKYGLIFDVDGTILDSFDAIYYSLDNVLKRYGVLDFSREELRSLMDYMSFMEIIRFLMEKYNVDSESMAELSSQ